MADATFYHGEPETIDYTPAAGDIALNQVVVLATVAANATGAGLTCGIAQHAITNATKGSLSFGGKWNVIAGSNVANYQPVYWDDTNNKVVNSSTNNSFFGCIVDRQSASGDVTNATVTAKHIGMTAP